MPAEKRVNPSQESRDVEVEGGIATLDSVNGGPQVGLPEVEVDAVVETARPQQGTPLVEIRVNESIEDMSFVASGRVERYTFEVGNRYRVPVHIAHELEAVGKLWH